MVTLASLVLAAALHPRQDGAQTLERKFTKGETRRYQVRTKLQLETDGTNQPIGIPEDVAFDYDFTTKVTDVLQSGFAVMDYRRPALIQTDGETFDTPPRSHNLITNEHIALTLSTINEVTDLKEMKIYGMRAAGGSLDSPLQTLPFATPMYQMAVMIGGSVR